MLVDWSDRQPGWADALREWRESSAGRTARVLLFGSHADLAAHAEARSHAIGPVMARSRFVEHLSEIVSNEVDREH